MKWLWILSVAFSASVEMIMGFLFLIPFVCYIIYIHLHICWSILESLEFILETTLILVCDYFNVLFNSICKFFNRGFLHLFSLGILMYFVILFIRFCCILIRFGSRVINWLCVIYLRVLSSPGGEGTWPM